jgi:sulfite reductase alpha subunit-like flavoprotein
MKKTGKSHLVIDREEFCQRLQGRIVSGQELLARQITSEETLENFKAEISGWSDYNLELLKQSFNNPENEYRQEYKDSYIHLGYLGTQSLDYRIESAKKKIACYTASLEKIKNKIDIIPAKKVF